MPALIRHGCGESHNAEQRIARDGAACRSPRDRMKARGRGIARRDFLNGLGRVAGGAAVLRTMAALGLASTAGACGSSSASSDPAIPPPPRPADPSPRPGDWPANAGAGKSVVVLGAGIAGMTAAYEMRKLGYACTVLEATSTAGGRNRTIRAGDTVAETDSAQTCSFDADSDLYFNPGPARIPHHHEFVLGYCRDFDVPLETFINDNRAALMHSGSAFGGQAQVARRVHADTRGHIASLLATAVNQNALDQELSATDQQNILRMLQQFGDLDGQYGYAGTSRGGFPGQEDTGSRRRGELLSPLDLQELIGEAFWQLRLDYPHGLEQQPTMLQPVGGMDRIARAFEARLADEIVFEAVVTEIRKTADGVGIVYQDRFGTPLRLDADFCICTIPATVLRSIANDFSNAHQAAINGFVYASAGKLAFQSRRFWEQDHNIYGGISWTTSDITQIWYPNHGFGKATGILIGAYPFGGTAGDTFTGQSPAERINSSIAQAGDLHPGFANEVGRGISVAWARVPFQLGAWGTSDPGVLLTPDDGIFFAGEHLSILQSWQEGAVLSAYRAIDGIVTAGLAPS
jgi:monoamine oxidase